MEKNFGKKPQDWKLVSSETNADCKVYKVLKQRFAHPDGRCGDFFVNESPDWVQAAAITEPEDGKEPCVILVNQFRFGTQKTSWEFPGGVAECGESPVDAAKRELLEETGYGGGKAKLVASYSPNPAIQNNYAHFVVIEGCKPLKPVNWDENEEIEVKLQPISKLDKLVSSGKIYHSIAIVSVYFLQKYLEKKSSKISPEKNQKSTKPRNAKKVARHTDK